MTPSKLKRARALVAKSRGPKTRGRIRSLLISSGWPASSELIDLLMAPTEPAPKPKTRKKKEATNG
jgi:hypothetical protein|tara:strand:- start:5022 stop:5219 length:198 start_codon:yes stop_codon:yes gene_type:complete